MHNFPNNYFKFTRREVVGIAGQLAALAFFGFLFDRHSKDNTPARTSRNPYLTDGNGIVTNVWADSSVFYTLKEHRIKYVFVDIGDVDKATGKITTPKKQIEQFMNNIASFEQENNYGFKILPWNVVIPQEGYRLDSREFRKNYVDEYVRLVNQFNLDGIHIDIEAIHGGFTGEYLDMLETWRIKLPENSILSVYGGSSTDDSDGNRNEWNWPESFFQEVFESGADVISIPTYDTDSRDEKEYREHLQDQLRRISGQKGGHFRFPVPTHKPAPELAAFALDEYLKGSSKYCNWPFLGVDLFATWTITEKEWTVFEQHLKALNDVSYLNRQNLKNFFCSIGIDP